MEKIAPVTEPKKSKKTIYKIKDNFMDFWFKFIYPNRSYIEDNNFKKFREFLDVYFEKHVSFAFEGIFMDFLKGQNAKDLLPVYITKIGTWYGYYRDGVSARESRLKSMLLHWMTMAMELSLPSANGRI